MEGIQVSVEKVGSHQNIAVIKVGGYIDTTTSAELEHSLSSTLKSNNHNIIIDLGNVDYISSAGLRSVLVITKKVKAKGGRLMLTSLQDPVKEVFEISGFSTIIPIKDSPNEALQEV